ncbi:MAG: hypothetical protein Q8882_02145 [Bacillota bacterium]|nr:hypothetical protein [Bacillota bacterium]
MLEIKIMADNLDYGLLAEKFIPEAIGEFSEKKGGFFGNLAGKLKGFSGAAAKAALNVMPQKVKEDLVIQLANEYKEKFIKSANITLNQKGIAAQINDIEVSVVEKNVR